MKQLPYHIAKRYLFAKKSHNIVNIISMISLFGFCIGTAALVIVLSVFNGFDSLITDKYNQFDPDIKIIPSTGKTFILDEDAETYLSQHPEIANFSKVIQEQALLQYNHKQTTAIVKGVSEHYAQVTGIDSLMLQGEFKLKERDTNGAVIGMGLAQTIGAGIKFINAIVVYAPKRKGRISLSNPDQSFVTNYFFPKGFFALYQPEIDNNYMLIDISVARELFQYDKEISSLEVRLIDDAHIKDIKTDLETYFGQKVIVQNRYEQKADLYRMLSMEKWMTFFIVIFILVIAIFNIVGTLSMLIMEKKRDIKTLQSIGASNEFIRNIFFTEGSMVAFFGALLGLFIGITFCLLQQYFGLIPLGTSGQYIVDSYPVELQLTDVVLIFFTVITIGISAIYFPVKYITKQFEI